LVQQALNTKFYHNEIIIAWSKARVLVQQLRLAVLRNGGVHEDLSSWCGRAIIDVLGLAAFGHEFDTLSDGGDKSDVYSIYWLTGSKSTSRLRYLWHRALWVILPTQLLYRLPIDEISAQWASRRRLECLCKIIIKKRVEVNKQLPVEEHRKDVLDTILRGSASEEECLNHVMGFLGGGYVPLISFLT
jgi:hypothetical protein